MKIKPWMWLAGGIGAFILLKDDIKRAMGLSNQTLLAGHRYRLSGVSNGVLRSNVLIPVQNQVITFGTSTFADPSGQSFPVEFVVDLTGSLTPF